MFPYLLLGFVTGVVFALNLSSHFQKPITMTRTAVLSTLASNNQSKKCSPTEIIIDTGNLAHIYDEFYKFYESNGEW